MAENLQNYIPENSVLNMENTEVPGDFSSPYSLIDWIKNLKISSTETSNYIIFYNRYLNEWYKKINKQKTNKVSFVRSQYINLLKEITLKYTTPDEKRFLSNLNFNDNQSLDIAIPFFTKKIKKICQYYSKNRDKLTNGVIRANLRGSNYGIETIIKKSIVNILEKNEFEPIGVNLPPLSSIISDFHVEIEESYDPQQHYYDVEPGSSYEKYDVKDPERIKFFGLDSTNVDNVSIYDLEQAIINAIKSYPFFVQELGFNNFTINFNLSTPNYAYLDQRDFQDYNNDSNEFNTNVYNYKKLYEKNLGTKLLSLSGNSEQGAVSGYALIPNYPYQNLLNRRFPTIAHTPEISDIKQEKNIGSFFTKDNLGVLLWNTYKKEYSFNRTLSAGEVLLIPDPEVGANVTGLSKTDHSLSGIDYQIDLQWNRYDWSNDYAFGKIYSDPKIHKFFPYTGKTEISEDSDEGISRITDVQDFWDDKIIWKNKDVFEFIGDDYYPLEKRKNYLLYNKGILTKYKTDIFGNHYGLFKDSLVNKYSNSSTATEYPSSTRIFSTLTSSLCSLYEKQNLQLGNVFVRLYDDTNIFPLSSALSGVFIKYPSYVRNELENLIQDFELIFNTVIIETPNYVVFDKINFDFDTKKFDAAYTKANFFKKYNVSSSIENYSNFWYDSQLKNIFVAFITLLPVNSATNEKIIYPKIYISNINNLDFNKIYPENENIQSLSSFVVNLSSESYNLNFNDRALLNINHQAQILGVLIKGYNNSGIPILQNYKFSRTFNKINLINHLIFKPCGFNYDKNYNDITTNQTVRHISYQSGLVGNQLYFNNFTSSVSSSSYYNYYYVATQPLTISDTVSSFVVLDQTLTNIFYVSAGTLNLNLRDVYGVLVFDFQGSQETYFTSLNQTVTAQAVSGNPISLTYVASGQHVLYVQPLNN